MMEKTINIIHILAPRKNMKFQIIDVSYTLSRDKYPIIHIFGLDENGSSITRHVHGFLPYMYALGVDPEKIKVKSKEQNITIRIIEEKKFLPLGYQTRPSNVMKITTIIPKDIRNIRYMVESMGGTTYESDVLFKNRFIIDHNLESMQWIITPNKENIMENEIIPININSDAPMKYLSLDIECLPTGEGIPVPETSPVILVSLAFDPPYMGRDTLVMVAKPINCHRPDVLSCNSERNMIQRLSDIIQDFDPDVIAGYNCNGFDFPFLSTRANILDVKFAVTRDGRSPWVREFMGVYTVSAVGRIILDMLPAIKTNPEIHLKNYKLSNVAKELLKIEKHDVKHTEMAELWASSDLSRFISYSRRDAVLVMELMKQQKSIEKYVALSKASGALLQDVVNGGQTVMIESLLFRKFKEEDRLIGTKPAEIDNVEDIKGAVVLEPKKGLSENVIILDFQSLYPSIMIAHNLCYSTMILEGTDLKDDPDITTTPVDGHFVKSHILKGIIPKILEELLAGRIEIKNAMKDCTDPQEWDLLDAKQYAMKILLNSLYGYSGYARARLFSPVITNSVTAYGRENLLHTKNVVENEAYKIFKDENIKFSIVLGDTDSLLLIPSSDKTYDIDVLQEIGEKIAEFITKELPSPMKLVFEAIAKRLLIVSKKRYAMYRFEEKGGKWEGKIKVKGIETVRRDWCDLTSQTLTKCLEMILKDGNVAEALVYAQGIINSIRNPVVTEELLQLLTLTRTYTKHVEEYNQKQPHIEMIKRMEAKGIKKYVIGERIPFVIVKSRKKHAQFTDKAEDIDNVIKNGLKIDSEYYIEKQILPPLLRIFSGLGIDEHVLSKDINQTNFKDWI